MLNLKAYIGWIQEHCTTVDTCSEGDVGCVDIHVRDTTMCVSSAQTTLQRHIRGLMQSRKIGGRVLSIDGRSFSSVQARLLATALATALQPSIPMRRVTDHVRAFRVQRLSRSLGGDALSQRIRKPSKQNLQQYSPSHSVSFLDGQAPLEHLV